MKTLTSEKITTAAEKWVKDLLVDDSSGHDWPHIERVRNLARQIATEEKADLLLVDLMALLHEMPDTKLNLFPTEAEALKAVQKFLESYQLTLQDSKEILDVISNLSYAKSSNNQKLTSKAGQITQDADRLDALGAIGIARCFSYGGHKGRSIWNPDIPWRQNVTPENYRQSPSSLHHFTEKLLKIKDQINTATGRRLAEHRHHITENFFHELMKEWHGEI